MNIAFKCPTCGSGEKNEFRKVADFTISAYEDVIEWSDLGDEIPSVKDKNIWYRSEIPPKVNEYRVVYVSHPFDERSESSFWTLFMPALSSINGWSEHPDEIDSSAFVKCNIDTVMALNENHAWLRVKVIEHISLAEAVWKLPEGDETVPITENTYRFHT